MAENNKLSLAALVNEIPCPNELKEAKDEYVKMVDILDKEIFIKAFVFMTSKDLDRYNQGNERSVHFMFECDGKLMRTATHSKRIVKGFDNLFNATNSYTLDIPLPTMITLTKLENGRDMYDFKF